MRTGPLALALSLAALPAPSRAYCRTTMPHTAPGLCETGTLVSWPVACLGLHLNTRDLGADGDAGQDLSALVRDAFATGVRAWAEGLAGSLAADAGADR
jgi:hypothetical protein